MRFIITFIICLSVACASWAHDPMKLRHIGNENSAVQLYLFSSLRCPHCADFHRNILPKIKRKYADSGKAYITLVEMVSDKDTLFASAALRCMPDDQANKLENKLFSEQMRWIGHKDVRQKIAEYAHTFGMNKKDFNACLDNDTLLEKIVEQRNNLARLYDVRRMPTLVVRHGDLVFTIEGADEKQVMDSLAEEFSVSN